MGNLLWIPDQLVGMKEKYGKIVFNLIAFLVGALICIGCVLKFVLGLNVEPPAQFLLFFTLILILSLIVHRLIDWSKFRLNNKADSSNENDSEQTSRLYYNPVWESDVDLEDNSEMYRRLHEDAQRTLDEHLTVFSDEAEKAGRIGRFNGLVLTVLVTAVTGFEVEAGKYINIATFVGLFLIAVGFASGMILQRTQEVEVGPGIGDFQTANEYGLSEDTYLEWIIISGYTEWISEAKRKSMRKARLVRLSIAVSLSGLLLLTGGTLITVMA